MTEHRPWSEVKDQIMADPERAEQIKAMQAAWDSGFIVTASDELLQAAADVARADQVMSRADDILSALDDMAREDGEKICPDCGGRGWKLYSGRITKDLSNVMKTCPTCQGNRYVPLSLGN